MSSLPARALRTIRKHDLFARGARVLVALSGGPDSVALLHLLRALELRGQLQLAGVGHFNHLLRGAESDDDEAFCRELAAAGGLAFEAGRADVSSAARRTGRSVEDTARTLRYGFLREAADRLRADVIAVGHTRDDQAETFLLRLIRGAGARGLGGIRPRAGRVVRPLLEIGRSELRDYAARHALAFREDASNADVSIPRNRVRHELLPLLGTYSPRIVHVLAGAAAQAQADEAYLSARATDLADSIVSRDECGVAVDAVALAALPPALASRVARLALEAVADGRFIGYGQIARLLGLLNAPAGASVSLPGATATRRGGCIRLGSPGQPPFTNSFRFPLSIPGEVACGGWSVSAQPLASSAGMDLPPARGGAAVVAAGPLAYPLAVRTRRRGDRFRPFGMGGRGRKLQDFFVDRKVPRADRDELPLVVDGRDRIVWIAGQGIAEDFRVTAPEQAVILLKARRLGGVG